MKSAIEFSYQAILESLRLNQVMHLKSGGLYLFIAPSSTKINGVLFDQAIHYRISDSNTKHVTFQFIRMVYNFYRENKSFPSRSYLREQLPHELCPIPCNYSVAIAIVTRFIQ
ncbi:MAG: hypothetical protein RLZZ65_100 [Bacteroidota bacterium]|jgi:hypothetical protein